MSTGSVLITPREVHLGAIDKTEYKERALRTLEKQHNVVVDLLADLIKHVKALESRVPSTGTIVTTNQTVQESITSSTVVPTTNITNITNTTAEGPDGFAMEFGDGISGVIPAGAISGLFTFQAGYKIVKSTIISKEATDAVIDIQFAPYDVFLIFNSLCPTNKPQLVASNNIEDIVLSGWQIAIALGTVVYGQVISNSASTKLTVTLKLERA